MTKEKLRVKGNYNEKITTKFKHSLDDDVINKAYLDEKLPKGECEISYIEKQYNEFKLLSNKQSGERVLIQRAPKTTIQKLNDKG